MKTDDIEGGIGSLKGAEKNTAVESLCSRWYLTAEAKI